MEFQDLKIGDKFKDMDGLVFMKTEPIQIIEVTDPALQEKYRLKIRNCVHLEGEWMGNLDTAPSYYYVEKI